MAKWQPGQSGNPAGRPRKAEKYAGAIAAAEDRIADRLPEIIDAQLQLALGGYEQVEEQYAPAGTVTIGGGEYLTLVYPDRKPDELVLVRRSVSVAAPDRAAGQYLIDRILGKPVAAVDATVDAPEDSALGRLLDAVARIYGDGGDGA